MPDFEVRIEKIVAGGDGFARHEGRVVFVPGTVPGERHLVRVVRDKKDYLKAESVECLEQGIGRRTPPCPYYATCGGCALMHLTPEAQLDAKRDILAESLTRALSAPYDGPLRLHMASELGYRNRLRFHVAFVESQPLAGFKKRASNHIVDVEQCLLGSETINLVWKRLRRTISKRRPLAQSLVSVELEESTHEPGRIAARFFVSSSDVLRKLDASFRENLLTEVGLDGLVVSVAGGGPVVRTGRSSVAHRVSDFVLDQSVGSFFQSNRYLLQELVDCVVADVSSDSRALDLFCGVGLFTVPLALRASSVVGVETETLSLRDARANAARASVRNVRFLRSDAESYVRRAKFRENDVVVTDPPRGGLSRALVEAIGESPLTSLRYVSCDPAALARDARQLSEHGFRIASLDLFDLFPNTHHFETVSFFSRRRDAP